MIKAKGRENTPPGNSLTVQMKGGKQNLERVFQFIFLSMALCPSVSFVVVSNQPNTATEWPEVSFLKIWLAPPLTVYYSFFLFLWMVRNA